MYSYDVIFCMCSAELIDVVVYNTQLVWLHMGPCVVVYASVLEHSCMYR